MKHGVSPTPDGPGIHLALEDIGGVPADLIGFSAVNEAPTCWSSLPGGIATAVYAQQYG